MKIKNLLTLTVATVATLTLAACGSKPAGAESTEKTAKIGILQLINQTALDDARKGFKAELARQGYKEGKNLKLDYVNAQGDQANLSTMSQQLKKDKNDLNLAIATPAAQAIQRIDKKTPLLFTAVSDPAAAGLVKNLDKPEANITGVTDMVSVAGQVKLLKRIAPKVKTVGLIYNAAEANSVTQIKSAKAALKALNLNVVEKTVASTNDVQQTMETLTAKADAVYIPADNTMAAAMATVGKVAAKKQVPVVPAASTMVNDGGLATNGFNYRDLGVQAAKQAVAILKGKKVSQVPVQKPAKVSVIINKDMAKQLHIDPATIK